MIYDGLVRGTGVYLMFGSSKSAQWMLWILGPERSLLAIFLIFYEDENVYRS